MIYKRTILLLIAGFFLISCSKKNESKEETITPSTDMKANLIDGTWELNYIMNETKSLDELFPNGLATVTIVSEESQISGSAGCNNFTGSCSIEGNELKVLEPMAVTRKMCPEMEGEDLFLKLLIKIDSYAVTDRGKNLNLLMGDTTVMKFNRK